MTTGPLDGVRVVDLSDERGIYGAKLLADLGADVLRPEPPDGDPLRQRGPLDATSGESLWYSYFASGRRTARFDVADAAQRALLQRCVERADVLLASTTSFAWQTIDIAAARAAKPALVHIDVSSFGDDGPWRDYLAPDLVAGALGGIVGTTGAPETSPLKTFGELNFMTVGAYTAVAALSALRHARETGEGQRVSVAAHECIAACLEHVLMFSLYDAKLNRGRVLPRQGSTNWTMAYKVMPAKSGAIMVTPTPVFDNQLAWLVEEDAHADLLEPQYAEPENAMARILRTMEVLQQWVATKDSEALFFEGQERHCPYGWVLPLEKLADNPQLAARNWWADYRLGERSVRGPGTPYRLSETPWRHRDARAIDAATLEQELGWSNAR